MDAPAAIRIVLAEMPGLMGVVVRDAVSSQPDMKIVDEISDGGQLSESVADARCDVLVAALSEPSRVPVAYQQLLFADVGVPFIALDPDGRRFQAYSRSVRREFEVSELVAVIRKLANAVNCKEI